MIITFASLQHVRGWSVQYILKATRLAMKASVFCKPAAPACAIFKREEERERKKSCQHVRFAPCEAHGRRNCDDPAPWSCPHSRGGRSLLRTAWLSAAVQRRCLRAVEYYGRAASAARVLWGDKGALCVVHANLQQSNALSEHTQTNTAADEATPLWLEAQRLLVECRRILNARLSAETCLVGRCFAVEEDFFARFLMITVEACFGALPPEKRAACWGVKRNVGYKACIDAAYQGLLFAYPAARHSLAELPPLMGEERSEAHAFALRCVSIMATTRQIDGSSERPFARLLRDLLASNLLEEPFKVELARAWDSPALQRALRARGALAEVDAAIDTRVDETLNKKLADDLAKHGLRWCALSSCAKQEMGVFDFKACSACKAVVYCSAEHGALHWTQGHRKECAALKAAGAKPRSTADEGGSPA